MSTLALYNVSGCFEQLPSGNVGQVLSQGLVGPEWVSATRIPIVDVGNYFAADNIEQALQQIGAAIVAGAAGGVTIDDCPMIRYCISSTMSSVYGVDYDDSQNRTILTLNNLPGISTPISASNYFIVANDPTYPNGARANLAQVAAAVGGAGSPAPWAKVGEGQQTAVDPVTLTDPIYHIGQMVRGAAAPTSNAGMENKGTFVNGAGNQTNSNDQAYNMLSGENNQAHGTKIIAFGTGNIVGSPSVNSSALGGNLNTINNSDNAAIAAGQNNLINVSARSFIGAGDSCKVFSGQNSGILAGLNNIINGPSTVAQSGIGAGASNTVKQSLSFIGAGQSNTIDSQHAFIGAGQGNTVSGDWGAIIAGQNNMTDFNAQWGVLCGGTNNVHRSFGGFLGAGDTNIVRDFRTSIVSGNNNEINSQVFGASVLNANDSFIGAGEFNVVWGEKSAIGAGAHNGAGGVRNFVGAGWTNAVNGTDNAIVGGFSNNIGALTSGCFIGGGQINQITSFGGVPVRNAVVFGTRGLVSHDGVFLFRSYTGTLPGVGSSIRADEFVAIAAGGFRFRTNAAVTIGADMPAGANSWTAVSAAALKGEFGKVDPRSILSRLLKVPIQTYRFKAHRYDEETQTTIEDGYHKHLNFGPTAEDWNAAFGDVLGEKVVTDEVDGKVIETPGISEGDKLSVALASVQGMAAIVDDLKKEIRDLRKMVMDLSKGGKPAPA